MNNNIELFLNFLKYERKLSNNTYLSYRYNLIKIARYFSDKDITYLSEDDIRNFIYYNKETSKTKSHYLSVLKVFYNFLYDNNLISKNPTDNLKSPKIDKRLPKYLTIEEVNKLLDIPLNKPIDYRNKAMLELLYATGIRITELLDLKLSNYHEEDAYIKVMGKGRKERIIPIGDITIKYLNLYLKDYRNYILKSKQSVYIFVNNNGERMSRQGFFKILKKICQKSGINKNISPHIIRHSFATHLLNNGADLKIIQELLGHENISTTEIYSHLTNQKIKDDYTHHPHFKI